MAMLRGLPQHMEHSGLDSEQKVAADADAVGDPIREQKTDPVNFPRQGVRVLSYSADRFRTKNAINSQRHRRAHAVALQKDHHIPHAALLLPSLHDTPGADFTDAVDLQDAQRLLGQNPQGVEAKGGDQPFRISGTDAFDQPRAQIFFNAFDGRRIDLLPMINLKLQAVTWVVFPGTEDFDLFSFGHRKQRTDNRHARGALGIEQSHRVARFRVLVGNAGNGALQR